MPESIHARPAGSSSSSRHTFTVPMTSPPSESRRPASVAVGETQTAHASRVAVSIHPRTALTHPARRPFSTAETTTAPKAVDDSVVDYPRPTHDGHEHEHEAPPHHEEVPKQDKKHGHDSEKKPFAYQKVEATRPTREGHFDHKGFGGGGRIAQPSGKGLA